MRVAFSAMLDASGRAARTFGGSGVGQVAAPLATGDIIVIGQGVTFPACVGDTPRGPTCVAVGRGCAVEMAHGRDMPLGLAVVELARLPLGGFKCSVLTRLAAQLVPRWPFVVLSSGHTTVGYPWDRPSSSGAAVPWRLKSCE